MSEQTGAPSVAVVVGLSGLARVLDGRSAFRAVVDAPAGAGLSQALAEAQPLKEANPSDVLFLLSSGHDGAEALARRLERIGHHVVIVGTGEPVLSEANGVTLTLLADALVNDALAALSRLPGVPYMLPDDDGEISLFESAEAAQAVAQAPEAPAPVRRTGGKRRVFAPAAEDHVVVAGGSPRRGRRRRTCRVRGGARRRRQGR